MKLTLNKWGNSNGLRIPVKLLNALGAETGDDIHAIIEGNRVILEKAKTENLKEMTIEEIFQDYQGESFKTELTEFEPLGDEKW